MLLYLPWLPLQEGVGFDLEIEQDKEEKQFDTFIKIIMKVEVKILNEMKNVKKRVEKLMNFKPYQQFKLILMEN